MSVFRAVGPKLLVVCCVVFVFGFPVQASDLATIVDAVREAENLYRSIEVVQQRIYRLGNPKYSHSRHLVTEDVRTQYVLQGDLLYLKVDDSQKTVGGDKKALNTLQGYDGKVMRVVEQDAFANINDERFVDNRLVPPHNLLLQYAYVTVPLSRFLRGEEGLRDDPSAGLFGSDDYHYEVELLRPAVVNGLDCETVAVNIWTDKITKAKAWTYTISLARDRNLLPIKMELVDRRYDPTQLFLVAEVKALREIGPGIWYPFSVSVISYDPHSWKEDGRLVTHWTNDIVVEKAELNPHYPVEFFQNIPIPKGMPVYVVKGDQIVENYLEGIPGQNTFIWWTVLIIAINLLLAVFIIRYIVNRYRTQARVAH